MQPFTILTAIAAPLEIAKIDTGMILPGRYMRRHRRPGHDYGEAFLYDLRFDDKAQPRPDFVINRPAYRGAKILAAQQLAVPPNGETLRREVGGQRFRQRVVRTRIADEDVAHRGLALWSC